METLDTTEVQQALLKLIDILSKDRLWTGINFRDEEGKECNLKDELKNIFNDNPEEIPKLVDYMMTEMQHIEIIVQNLRKLYPDVIDWQDRDIVSMHVAERAISWSFKINVRSDTNETFSSIDLNINLELLTVCKPFHVFERLFNVFNTLKINYLLHGHLMTDTKQSLNTNPVWGNLDFSFSINNNEELLTDLFAINPPACLKALKDSPEKYHRMKDHLLATMMKSNTMYVYPKIVASVILYSPDKRHTVGALSHFELNHKPFNSKQGGGEDDPHNNDFDGSNNLNTRNGVRNMDGHLEPDGASMSATSPSTMAAALLAAAGAINNGGDPGNPGNDGKSNNGGKGGGGENQKGNPVQYSKRFTPNDHGLVIKSSDCLKWGNAYSNWNRAQVVELIKQLGIILSKKRKVKGMMAAVKHHLEDYDKALILATVPKMVLVDIVIKWMLGGGLMHYFGQKDTSGFAKKDRNITSSYRGNVMMQHFLVNKSCSISSSYHPSYCVTEKPKCVCPRSCDGGDRPMINLGLGGCQRSSTHKSHDMSTEDQPTKFPTNIPTKIFQNNHNGCKKLARLHPAYCTRVVPITSSKEAISKEMRYVMFKMKYNEDSAKCPNNESLLRASKDTVIEMSAMLPGYALAFMNALVLNPPEKILQNLDDRGIDVFEMYDRYSSLIGYWGDLKLMKNPNQTVMLQTLKHMPSFFENLKIFLDIDAGIERLEQIIKSASNSTTSDDNGSDGGTSSSGDDCRSKKKGRKFKKQEHRRNHDFGDSDSESNNNDSDEDEKKSSKKKRHSNKKKKQQQQQQRNSSSSSNKKQKISTSMKLLEQMYQNNSSFSLDSSVIVAGQATTVFGTSVFSKRYIALEKQTIPFAKMIMSRLSLLKDYSKRAVDEMTVEQKASYFQDCIEQLIELFKAKTQATSVSVYNSNLVIYAELKVDGVHGSLSAKNSISFARINVSPICCSTANDYIARERETDIDDAANQNVYDRLKDEALVIDSDNDVNVEEVMFDDKDDNIVATSLVKYFEKTTATNTTTTKKKNTKTEVKSKYTTTTTTNNKNNNNNNKKDKEENENEINDNDDYNDVKKRASKKQWNELLERSKETLMAKAGQKQKAIREEGSAREDEEEEEEAAPASKRLRIYNKNVEVKEEMNKTLTPSPEPEETVAAKMEEEEKKEKGKENEKEEEEEEEEKEEKDINEDKGVNPIVSDDYVDSSGSEADL